MNETCMVSRSADMCMHHQVMLCFAQQAIHVSFPVQSARLLSEDVYAV